MALLFFIQVLYIQRSKHMICYLFLEILTHILNNQKISEVSFLHNQKQPVAYISFSAGTIERISSCKD